MRGEARAKEGRDGDLSGGVQDGGRVGQQGARGVHQAKPRRPGAPPAVAAARMRARSFFRAGAYGASVERVARITCSPVSVAPACVSDGTSIAKPFCIASVAVAMSCTSLAPPVPTPP